LVAGIACKLYSAAQLLCTRLLSQGAAAALHIVLMLAVLAQEVKAAALQHRDVAGGGIYVGLGGVALTYLRMAQQVQRGFR
jgi:hypothetical protein